MPNPEVLGVIIGATLTVFTFSYLLGDNFLHRLTLHIFAGALVGYSLGIVINALGRIVVESLKARDLVVLIPFLLGLLLLFTKSIRRLAYVGSLPLAYVVGVGVAVALWGAILGTAYPQIEATASALNVRNLIEGVFVVGGTVCALLAFDFTLGQRPRGLIGLVGKPVQILGGIGRVFLVVAFGVAFAGALTASLSVLIGRIYYFIELLQNLGFMR